MTVARGKAAKLVPDAEFASVWGSPSWFFCTLSLSPGSGPTQPRPPLFPAGAGHKAGSHSRPLTRPHPVRSRTARRDRNGSPPAAGRKRQSLFPQPGRSCDHRHSRVTPRTRLRVGSAANAQAWHLRFRLQQPGGLPAGRNYNRAGSVNDPRDGTAVFQVACPMSQKTTGDTAAAARGFELGRLRGYRREAPGRIFLTAAPAGVAFAKGRSEIAVGSQG